MRQPTHPPHNITLHHNGDGGWRDDSHSRVSGNFNGNKQLPDRRATATSAAESDYEEDGDAKQSVISHLSHAENGIDQW
jgi:hypothetical protein